MRAFIGYLLACVLWGAVANAQMMPTGSFVQGAVSGGPSFVGIGDVKPQTFYVGLRAYTSAIAAAGTQPLINVQRLTDNNTCDILVASNGGFGNTANCSTGGDNGKTALGFCTDTAGGFGSISLSTLTLTSGGPFNVGDIVYGANVTTGTQVTAVLGGNTYTVVPSQGVGLEAFTTTGCFPTNWYDQTLNNACVNGGAASCDLSRNTFGGTGQPHFEYLVFNCNGSLPCVQSSGNDTFITTPVAVTFTPATGNGSFLSANACIPSTCQIECTTSSSNGDSQNQIHFQGGGLQHAQTVGGTSGTATATFSDAVKIWHSFIGTIGSGANNSSIVADGSTGVGTIVGSTTTAHPVIAKNSNSPNQCLISEAGFADNVIFTPTEIANLYANQKSYWGTP